MSNPFLIFRTILKLLNKKDSTAYKINEMLFASIFLTARVILTPPLLIYMFEGHNVLYSVKLGICFILYVQLFWAYRILFLIIDGAREPYVKKEKKAPAWIEYSFIVLEAIQNNPKVKKTVSLIQFIVVIVLPHVYYGYVTKTLKFNLVF